MNRKDFAVIEKLRDAGYAVTIFNPQELQGACPGRVEDRLVELGWDVIECLSSEPQ